MSVYMVKGVMSAPKQGKRSSSIEVRERSKDIIDGEGWIQTHLGFSLLKHLEGQTSKLSSSEIFEIFTFPCKWLNDVVVMVSSRKRDRIHPFQNKYFFYVVIQRKIIATKKQRWFSVSLKEHHRIFRNGITAKSFSVTGVQITEWYLDNLLYIFWDWMMIKNIICWNRIE